MLVRAFRRQRSRFYGGRLPLPILSREPPAGLRVPFVPRSLWFSPRCLPGVTAIATVFAARKRTMIRHLWKMAILAGRILKHTLNAGLAPIERRAGRGFPRQPRPAQ